MLNGQYALVDSTTQRILGIIDDPRPTAPTGEPAREPNLNQKYLPVKDYFPEQLQDRKLQKYEITYEIDESGAHVNKIFNVVNLPRWGQFNLAVLMTPEYQAACFAIESGGLRGVVSTIVTALSNVSTGIITPEQFAPYYDQFCSAGAVSQETKDIWAAIAQANYLPQEFIDVIA